MKYTFNITNDYKVSVELDGNKIDEVGPFGDAEGAAYWAGEMDKKYSDNPTFVYPGGEPEAEPAVVKA